MYDTNERGQISSTIPVQDGDGEVLGDIVFSASNIRKERTGEHAVLALRWNRNQLDYDNFNITRSPDRGRLANSAWKLLPLQVKAVFPQEKMKAELDLFCEGLWEAHVGRIEIEELSPSPDRKPQSMLGPFIIDHGGTILFSQPGLGKTWIAMLVAQTLNTGATAVWGVKRNRPVLFINLERDKSAFEERLAQVNLALGLPEDTPMRVINRRGASLKDVEHAAQRYVEENGIGCVVLDSISRAGAGNIIDPTVANEVMDTLNRICPTWFAIAHAPKPQKSRDGSVATETVIGSQMFAAAADLTLNLQSQEYPDRLLIKLAKGKSNIKLDANEWHYLLDMKGGKLNSVRPVSQIEWKVDGDQH